MEQQPARENGLVVSFFYNTALETDRQCTRGFRRSDDFP